jgi:hypothetical protein
VAIYRFSARQIQRRKGNTLLGVLSYNIGRNLHPVGPNQIAQEDPRAERVKFTRIMAPPGSPEWTFDRQRLCQEVEKFERRVDSCLGREFVLALPHELSLEQNVWLVQDFVRENFMRRGLICDLAIHDPDRGADDRNVHVHIVVYADRPFDPAMGTWGKKDREIRQKFHLKKLRENWANLANRHLARHNIAARIDHRSLANQGLDRTPQIHIGAKACAMERRGVPSERGKQNRAIQRINAGSPLRQFAFGLSQSGSRPAQIEADLDDSEELDFTERKDLWGIARGPR